MKYQIRGYKDIDGNRYFTPMARVYGVYWNFIKPIYTLNHNGAEVRINALFIHDFFGESLKFNSVEEAFNFIKSCEKDERFKKVLEEKRKNVNFVSLSDFFIRVFKLPFLKIKYESDEISELEGETNEV